MLELKNKNIIVTGADGFVGEHLCETLRDIGANVFATDYMLRKTETYKLDISNADEVDDYVADLASQDIWIDGVVNNAAVSYKGAEIKDEDLERTMKVNLQGTYNCTTKFRKLMTMGAIVNIASVFGMLSPDFRTYKADPKLYNSSIYGATKAGIIQMTRYYAVHYAPDIRVNTISPGGIWQSHDEAFVKEYSERVPMGRMAKVEEIVRPVLFLLSPLSSYITGQNLVVDGGLSAW